MIPAGDIAAREHARKTIRKNTYKHILEQFSRKVQAAAERREKSATLQVPPMVLGFPMYPYEEALWYLRRQLILAGYEVEQGLEQGQYIVKWEKAKKQAAAAPAAAPTHAPGDDLFAGLANMQKVAAQLRKK
jgi:Family of unknown function (DUF5759)